MSSASDWIPPREQDFADLCERWVPIITDAAKQAQFGWIQTECAALAAKITRFLDTRRTYHDDNSTENRLIKDEAKVEAARDMRDFARTDVRNNKKMRDEDRLPLGILPVDDKPTPHRLPRQQKSKIYVSS